MLPSELWMVLRYLCGCTCPEWERAIPGDPAHNYMRHLIEAHLEERSA